HGPQHSPSNLPSHANAAWPPTKRVRPRIFRSYARRLTIWKLRRGPTPGNVKLLLPPRQSRGSLEYSRRSEIVQATPEISSLAPAQHVVNAVVGSTIAPATAAPARSHGTTAP